MLLTFIETLIKIINIISEIGTIEQRYLETNSKTKYSKRKNLSQSYDKSPYTQRKIQNAT